MARQHLRPEHSSCNPLCWATRSMANLFGREFLNLDAAFLQDLHSLELEGALSIDLWSEEHDKFVATRLRFTPQRDR